MNPSSAGRKTAGQITAYAAAQLSAQYRTHAFSILIVKDYARFIRWDRSGAIVTEPVYYSSSGLEELFQFFIRYNSAEKKVRGCDVTVRLPNRREWERAHAIEGLEEAKQLLVVTVPGADGQESQDYVVEAPMAKPYAPPGRCTRISIALDLKRSKRVLLKDSWRVACDGMEKEGDIYKMFQEAEEPVPNVPYCSASGDIGEDDFHLTQTQKFVDSSWCSHGFRFQLTPHRHHRLVLDDIGRPLDTFQRSSEMVKAIHAALKGHEGALKLKILHHDISSANILIMDKPTSKGHKDGGLLIDWDLCKKIDENEKPRQFTRTGTWQFMAADLVLDPKKPHTFVHDLESAFFVLLLQSLQYLPSSWCEDTRNSIIQTVFNPPVFGNSGGINKLTFMQSKATKSMKLSFNNNEPLSDLIQNLQVALHVRHVPRPAVEETECDDKKIQVNTYLAEEHDERCYSRCILKVIQGKTKSVQVRERLSVKRFLSLGFTSTRLMSQVQLWYCSAEVKLRSSAKYMGFIYYKDNGRQIRRTMRSKYRVQ
ncbi:hypothetical protein JOM56_014425 [Amanita muscaria]